MKHFKTILILSMIVLSISGCSKKETGKAVINSNNNTTNQSTQSNEKSEKVESSALDIIKGKCILYDSDMSLYPMIIYFDEDKYVEYIPYSDGAQSEVVDVIVDKNKVTYKMELQEIDYDSYDSFDSEKVSFYEAVIEVIDENTIRYVNGANPSDTYTLMSKTEVAAKMKEYEEKIANGYSLEDKSNDYIISDSSYRKLTKEELSQYSLKELSYIRNEIFARYGYVFKSEEFNTYFNQKDWYIPNEYFDGNIESLSEIEKYNVNLIKELEGK